MKNLLLFLIVLSVFSCKKEEVAPTSTIQTATIQPVKYYDAYLRIEKKSSSDQIDSVAVFLKKKYTNKTLKYYGSIYKFSTIDCEGLLCKLDTGAYMVRLDVMSNGLMGVQSTTNSEFNVFPIQCNSIVVPH